MPARTASRHLAEVDTKPASPVGGVLDNFNRADENPLAGSWHSLTGLSDYPRVVSNQVKSTAGGNYTDSLYSALSPTGQEWYFTLSTIPASGEQVGVIACSGIASNNWTGGYVFVWNNGTGYNLNQLLGGSIGAKQGYPPAPVNGDKLRILVNQGIVEGYVFHSGDWYLVWRAVDNAFTSGEGGIHIHGTTLVIDDFGGGALPINSLDSATVRVNITPSSADIKGAEDSGTPLVKITPSGSEFPAHWYTDAGTAVVAIAPVGVEHPIPFDSDLGIVSAEQRWAMTAESTGEVTPSPSGSTRFSMSAENRWSIGSTFK